jgi:ATP-dependent DNA helicase RecG
MLTPEQLTDLLADTESDRLECTISTTNTDKFAQAVCAFANDLPNHRRPGYLVVGVDDRGSPAGLTVTDQLLQNLGALRSDGNILPLPMLNVAKIALPGGDAAVVEVHPSDLPPVRYKGQVWVRVGPRKAVASEQEERMLMERRIAGARSFDALAVAEASLADISLPMFGVYRQSVIAPDIVAANHRLMEEQLASLRFFDNRMGAPTVAGILLFGKNPRYFLPGAYIQFLRLSGNELTELPIDQAEIAGDLLAVLREADLRIKTNIATGLKQVDILRERQTPDYPEGAIRELLLNAVMHRDYQSHTPARFYWYADHIEIQSPGGLYGEVTAETLTTASSYRNPILAEAMKALGYVNRFGYGIQRAQRLLAMNGNLPPEFSISDKFFRVVIRRAH